MKTKRMLATVLVLGLLAGLLVSATLAQEGPQAASAPQDMVDDAFTYQGKLTDGGSPANGTYDFQFTLWDDPDTGSQVGYPVTVEDRDVTDGLFTVELGFGWSRFTGDALWLEIGVRPGSSSGEYTTLSPRQPLTVAPYALSLRPGAKVIGDTAALAALTVKDTNTAVGKGLWGESSAGGGYGVYGTAPRFGVYGEASATTDYAYGVYGKAAAGSLSGGAGVKGVNNATSGKAYGVWGVTYSSEGYGGYFENRDGGVDIMAAGSGVIKSKADSVLYLSPHDMVVRGSSGVSITPLDNGGADIHYTTSGWKYISLPVSTFGTLFDSPLYVRYVMVCYKTDAGGYIGVTSVIKNDGGTGATNYILDSTNRTSSTWKCYTIVDSTPSVIDNSTWVQFNIWSNGTGHTYIYTVELALTETP